MSNGLDKRLDIGLQSPAPEGGAEAVLFSESKLKFFVDFFGSHLSSDINR